MKNANYAFKSDYARVKLVFENSGYIILCPSACLVDQDRSSSETVRFIYLLFVKRLH